jgi:signal transduction histidine kinase
METSVLDLMRGEMLKQCESSPATFHPEMIPSPMLQRRGSFRESVANGLHYQAHGGGLPLVRLFPYNRRFQPHHADSPVIDDQLIRGIRSGRDVVARPIHFEERTGFEALIAIPGGNACSYVLVQRPIPAILSSSPFQIRTALAWFFPSLGLLGAVYFGLGILVRRVTRLTREVRTSVKLGYADLATDESNDEIAELRRAFIDAGREIQTQLSNVETKERVLREFLANTTHDVLIPLTVLQGHLATLVEEKRASGLQPSEALNGALRESQYIGALLRNLTLTAKLDGQQRETYTDKIDLGDLVGRATLRLEFLAKQHRIELNHSVPDAPLLVMGDPVAIEQAVGNVIYNAVAYNRPGGHVAAILESADGGTFSLRVIDDGPGVPAEEITRLTERHYRGNEARSRRKGGGLGLNIAHRVCELHGWSLSIGPSEANGLEVVFQGNVSVG